jgi:flavin reductase (DIM6/NTAB) family NADH-FMN oxidoreductase RutF/DNA-binding FadR family transcriptional regulator
MLEITMPDVVTRPEPAEPRTRALTSAEFRDVIGHFASGVTVITSLDGDRRVGTTASAVCSLSLEPPMVLICMNKTSVTGAAVAASEHFAVNILAEHQRGIAEHFASKDPDKFAAIAATAGARGQPLLHEAVAYLECRVVEQVTGGTHTVFLAEVDRATANGGAPLAYFRGEFGRLEMSDDQVFYETLRERALGGALRSGESLDLQGLAEEFQVPLGPLYHALGKLTSDGVVERRAGGSFVVRPVTWEVVSDAIDSRCAIELGVVDLTVGRIGDADIRRLRRASLAWHPVADDGTPLELDRSVTLSMDFHETLVSLAGRDALIQAYRRLAVPGILAAAFSGYKLSAEDRSFEHEHDELIAACAVGDAAEARDVVLRHNEHVKSAARRALTAA